MQLLPQQPKFSVATQHVNLPTFLWKHRYKPRSQVSRQMPRVDHKWVRRCCLSWTCLFNATLECTSPAKRFPLKTANLKSTSTTKTRTNKYTRRLRYAGRTLLKLINTKKLKYKVSKNKHTTDEDKDNQIHSQIKIHNEHLMKITQIGKHKKLNMNITKIGKYKKNSTAVLWPNTKHMKITKYKKLNMTEHKTDMNITKIGKYQKNWTAVLWRSTKQIWTLLNIILIMTVHKTDMNITKCEIWTWRSTKQTWTLLKNWTAFQPWNTKLT